MKLSVFAVLLADKSLDEACKYLADSGVQAVEIGCGGFPGKAHCNPEELLKDDKKIAEFKNTIEKHGLEIAALSTHATRCTRTRRSPRCSTTTLSTPSSWRRSSALTA